MDLAWNNLQRLIFHKTEPNQIIYKERKKVNVGKRMNEIFSLVDILTERKKERKKEVVHFLIGTNEKKKKDKKEGRKEYRKSEKRKDDEEMTQ